MITPEEQGFDIHHSPHVDHENQPGRRKARAALPKAAPLAGTARLGARCPVSLTLTLGSGGGGWVVVSVAQGEFMAPMDETLWSLMSRIQRGEYRPRPRKPKKLRRGPQGDV